MMKKLLIAILLAVFSVQGAVVAIGADLSPVFQAQHVVNGLDALDALDADAGDADDLNRSAAVEELSDYLPAVPHSGSAEYSCPAGRLPAILFASIQLPAIKPPPRA